MILKDYRSSISMVLAIFIFLVFSKIFYGNKDESDFKYYFIFTSYVLMDIQRNLYNDPFSFYDFPKILVFGAVIFVAWAILTLASQSKRGEFLINNPVVDKISFIFISIVAVICSMPFSLINDEKIKIYGISSRDYFITLILALFIHFAFKYIVDKKVLKKYFVNNDIYKKIFLISEIIFILLFVIVTFYNIFNFDRFIFISLD
ncbi:hypothetical protein KQI68_07525 [Peptoniphilus sp. MSJ-1]|uniref:Uncharacterized protein n=1 Tax=Peptoniphilus ovalis TaxID=2841503 RepID=A0ABS6FHM6_9FIRM|nr:hypothetical protein [Peptoniphilus ovalis]MBU5669681.1 hypothetical protein [Peptoniphilus ovalis]